MQKTILNLFLFVTTLLCTTQAMNRKHNSRYCPYSSHRKKSNQLTKQKYALINRVGSQEQAIRDYKAQQKRQPIVALLLCFTKKSQASLPPELIECIFQLIACYNQGPIYLKHFYHPLEGIRRNQTKELEIRLEKKFKNDQDWYAINMPQYSKYQKLLCSLFIHNIQNRKPQELDQDDLNDFQILIATGINPNLIFSQNRSMLHLAAQADFVPIVKMMLDAGAYVDIRDNLDHTPLHNAIASNNVEVVKLLLSAGAYVKDRAYSKGWYTPLHWAGYKISTCGYEIVMILLKAGADPEACDARDRTPFDWAQFWGKATVQKALLDYDLNESQIFQNE